MQKKGFTLAELAIVLIIIGIIIGMVIKANNLIIVTKVRSDVSRVIKIQNAMYEYASITNSRVPPIIHQVFVDHKTIGLTEKDMTITSERNLFYSIPVGKFDKQNIFTRHYSPFSANTEAAITTTETAENDKYSPLLFPRRLSCNIELMLDDKSLISGDGRTNSKGPVKDDLKYDDCFGETGKKHYVYRVFLIK